MSIPPGPTPPLPEEGAEPDVSVDVAKIDWERAWKTLLTVIQESSLDRQLAQALTGAAAAQEGERLAAFMSVVGQSIERSRAKVGRVARGEPDEPADAGEALATWIAKVIISVAMMVGRQVGDAIDEVEKVSGEKLLKAAAAGLSDYFGIEIAPAELSVKGGTDQRRAVSEKIGAFVLKQMFGEFTQTGELTPAQGAENASRLLGFNFSTALEGWMSGGVLSKAVSGLVPNWADLDDIFAQVMGLGRLNRRILGPLLDATIVIPWRWDINKRLRPRFFSEFQLVRTLFRGEITEADYFEGMARIGWSREKAAQLKVVNSRLPEKEDIAKGVELGVLTEDDVVRLFGELGYHPEMANLMAVVARDDRIRTLNNSLESLARDMFRDREISEAELRQMLELAGRSRKEIETLIGLAFIERSRPRQLTQGTMERAFLKELVDLGQLRDFYRQQGYTVGDALILELLILDKKFTAEERERKRREVEQAKAEKEKN